jgi:hypothetical protein
MSQNKFKALVGNAVCVIVAGLLIARHPRDLFVWGLCLGIIYQHGVRPWSHTIGIPWLYLKIFTGLGFIYALSRQYYDLAVVMGYSFASKFDNQVPLLMLISCLIVMHACYFSGQITNTKADNQNANNA